jgi:hypothetical protein
VRGPRDEGGGYETGYGSADQHVAAAENARLITRAALRRSVGLEGRHTVRTMDRWVWHGQDAARHLDSTGRVGKEPP